MRRRHQNGQVLVRGQKRVIAWWEDGHRRKLTLGNVSRVTKSEAQRRLAEILGPINNREAPPSKAWMFSDLVGQIYLPFFERKWKRSTAMTNRDRMNHHLVRDLG